MDGGGGGHRGGGRSREMVTMVGKERMGWGEEVGVSLRDHDSLSRDQAREVL
jgi:hypothetical protein